MKTKTARKPKPGDSMKCPVCRKAVVLERSLLGGARIPKHTAPAMCLGTGTVLGEPA
jgi:hypothetical protein